MIQKKLNEQNGIEYVVELAGGELKTIVQGPSPRFAVGQEVFVMVSNKGRSRVQSR